MLTSSDHDRNVIVSAELTVALSAAKSNGEDGSKSQVCLSVYDCLPLSTATVRAVVSLYPYCVFTGERDRR